MAEVASAFVTLVPSAKGFGKGIQREIGGEVDRAGKDGGKRFGTGMAAGIGGIATKVFAPLAAAAAGVSIAGFFKDAVAGASDLQESGSKINAIFGKQGAAAVQSFASQGAKALGQTQLQVLDAAGTFGTFGKAAGLAGGDLAKFSTGFAGLSTDLASFYNTSPEEAVQAIGAALRGEAEPIRKYGVLLDDATLRQEALALGLVKTTKEALTPQQKVLAAQAAIYKQTKDAQGDFSRTSGGLANQQRILSAQWSDFKTTLGAELLPVVTKFFTFLNDKGVPALTGLGDKVGPVGDAIKGLFDLFVKGDFTGGLGKALGVEEDSDIVTSFFRIRDGVLTAFGAVSAFIRGEVIPRYRMIANTVRVLVATVIPIVQAFVAGMLARIRPLMPQIRAIFQQIKTNITSALELVRLVIQRVTQVISYIWSRWGNQIMNIVARVFRAVVGVIGGALKVIGGIIKLAIALLKGDWSGAWAAVKQIVAGAWQGIKSVVSLGIDGVVALAKNLGRQFMDGLGDMGSMLKGAGEKLIQGLIDGITRRLEDVKRTAKSVAQAIKDFFPGSPVRTGPLTSWNHGGAGKRLGGMLADGLDSSRLTVAAASRNLARAVVTPVGAPVGGVAAGGVGARTDLSEASLQRLAAIMQQTPMKAVVATGNIDRAIGGTL